MRVLIDTNILLRSAQPDHPLSSLATRATSKLIRQNESVLFCSQNISEFWNVASRPSSANGLGMSLNDVLAEVSSIEALLTILPDSPAVYNEWKRLVTRYGVHGVKVYDARLAAVASVYGVEKILTFNVADFARYSHIAAFSPAAVEGT